MNPEKGSPISSILKMDNGGQAPFYLDTFQTEVGCIDPSGNLYQSLAFVEAGFFTTYQVVNPLSMDEVSSAFVANTYIKIHIDKVTSKGLYVQHHVLASGITANKNGQCDISIQDPGSHTKTLLSQYLTNGWSIRDFKRYFYSPVI